MDIAAQEEREFAFPPPLCSIWALKGLDDTTHVGEGLLSQMPVSPRHALTDTSRNNVLPASGHPLGQSSWHIKFTTTEYIIQFGWFIFLLRLIAEILKKHF